MYWPLRRFQEILPAEEWLLAAQGNRLNPASVTTKFAVSTGKTFGSRTACINEIYKLGALGAGNVAGLIQDEHLDIRLDYFCLRVR